MSTRLIVVDDPLFSLHAAPGLHPERPERLVAARAALKSSAPFLSSVNLEPRDASDDELLRVHEPILLERLAQAEGNTGYFDPDTFFGRHSIAAARRAAGGACTLMDHLRAENARFGLALVRPPGHHARPGAPMGFCLLNNAAVAAAHARAQGAERVVIVDWDVHHGNGTEEIFRSDPGVLYISLHQFPFYPGTGAASEQGVGEGAGYTVNIPLSPGAGDVVYTEAFRRIVNPVVEQYQPDLAIVSAGFDAHRRDPLGSMDLTERGYASMLQCLLATLPEKAPVAVLLEGGYDLDALEASLYATLQTLADKAPIEKISGPISNRHADELRRVESAQHRYWHL
ncbi:MAG TPA: histone deacetylase [Polyangiaceae bacterium]|jgi:acetoin utilization deacetylase AcuC-like enzyme